MAGGVRRPWVRGVVWWLVKPNKRNLESCCTPMAEAHEPGRESSIPEYASQYGAEYYRNRFGPDPYERSTPHWTEFFGGIASEIIRSLKPRKVFDAGCAWGFLVEAFWDRGVERSEERRVGKECRSRWSP